MSFDPRDAPNLDLQLRTLEKIAEQIDDIEYPFFLSDLYAADAVALQFRVVGKRAKKLSDDFKDPFPEIEWGKIISLRHLIAHEYDRVDRTRTWEIATIFAPALYEKLPEPPPPEAFD